MLPLHEAREALAAVDLRPGLTVDEVHARLAQGMRLRDTGQRILAYYLFEMEDRRLHQLTGHARTTQYAEDRLGLERRRAGELIAVGRKLLDLPLVDGAFCRQQIGWSKVLQLVKVAVPEHEEAWLERARTLSCRELAREVQRARPGRPPPAAGELKGLPEVRFRVSTSVSTLTHQKLDLAKQKLAAELGRPVDDAECLDVLAELFLQFEDDGTVPGRTHVPSSLYRIVLRPGEQAKDLVIDTDDGPLHVSEQTPCIRCDAERDTGGDAPRDVDRKTPPALRRRVLKRDGGRCRCCSSRQRLMVHHIRYRSKGGATRASNLITLCVRCHALVHADLLVLEGGVADAIRFCDAKGGPLAEQCEPVEPAALLQLNAPMPVDTQEETPPPAPQPPHEVFASIVGQAALLGRLETALRGSQARERAFPHVLFTGPPGTGKTTFARGIADCLGTKLHEVCGPLLRDGPDLFRVLGSMRPGEVLFLDEVHAVPRAVLEALYQEMLERPAFTVIAATTEEGDLPDALRSRFGLRESLGHYELDDLAALVAAKAAKEDFTLSRRAAAQVATSARGTPREALRLLDRVLDAVAGSHRTHVARRDVDRVLRALGYDDDGLEPAERRYLDVLRESRGPVSLSRLARMLGESPSTVSRHLEPRLFRRGLVHMTPHGRIAAIYESDSRLMAMAQ